MKIRLSELRRIIRETIEEEIEEAEKKDVTGDGEADFTDIMASRMIASGLPKKKAIKKAEKTTQKY